MMSDREKKKTMMILMMQSPSPRAAIRTKKRKRNKKKPSLSDLKKSGSQFGQEPPVSHRKEWRRQKTLSMILKTVGFA